jgi:hypothetical protein
MDAGHIIIFLQKSKLDNIDLLKLLLEQNIILQQIIGHLHV